MIPNWAILTLDALTTALLAAALVAALAAGRRFTGPSRAILASIILVASVVGESSVLQWFDPLSRGERLANFVMPLIPTLWLFLLVMESDRADRDRVAASEAKYRALVENSGVAIITVDAGRLITVWNRGAEAMYGHKAEEIIGRHVSLIYPEETREEVTRDIMPTLQRDGAWFGEVAMIRKDGTRFTGFISLSRIFDATHKTLATLGVITDVSEQIKLRDQLIQSQKMETVGTLAGGIAHDFNNLLTAIQGFAGLMKTSLDPASEDYDSVVNIDHAAQRGAQLVRQLMTFSQRQPTKAEAVDLNEVIQEACDLVGRTFPKTIDVGARLDPNLHAIRGDSIQMHQVVMNLSVNARDAMPRGGQLLISTQNLDLAPDDPRTAGFRPGPCVCLTVSDTGQGIPPEIQSRIFEPFFTTKAPSAGTGLGLATVYAIIKRHSGRIVLKSEVGQGTTFSIYLPALGSCEAVASASASQQPVAAQ
jgi:two-component system, cell cycle sensor histidine kinase and response regulator CckA